MNTVTTERIIDLGALPFPAWAKVSAGVMAVTADVPINDLEAAVAAAPGLAPPIDIEAARDLAARLATVDKVRNTNLDNDTLAALATIYPPLTVGLNVKAGEVYSWDGTLVEVIQSHTTQQDWIDAMDASLFKIHRSYGVVTDWIQPTGAHDAYQAGEAVRYDGDIYVSKINANTTVPGSDDRWWELVAN